MNILKHLKQHGDDEGFEPLDPESATDAAPGSRAKIETMAQRVLEGQEIHHESDRNYYMRMSGPTKGVDARARIGNNTRF